MMVLADGVRTDEAAGAAGAGAAGAGQRGPAWLGLVPLRRPGPRRRTSSRRPSSTVTVCSSLPTSSSWRDHDVPAQESFACTCPAFWIYLHDFVAAVKHGDGRLQDVIVPVSDTHIEQRIPTRGTVRDVQINRDSAALARFSELQRAAGR